MCTAPVAALTIDAKPRIRPCDRKTVPAVAERRIDGGSVGETVYMPLGVDVKRVIFPRAAGTTGDDSVWPLPGLGTDDDADSCNAFVDRPTPWILERLKHEERRAVGQDQRRRDGVRNGLGQLCRERCPRPGRPGSRDHQREAAGPRSGWHRWAWTRSSVAAASGRAICPLALASAVAAVLRKAARGRASHAPLPVYRVGPQARHGLDTRPQHAPHHNGAVRRDGGGGTASPDRERDVLALPGALRRGRGEVNNLRVGSPRRDSAATDELGDEGVVLAIDLLR